MGWQFEEMGQTILSDEALFCFYIQRTKSLTSTRLCHLSKQMYKINNGFFTFNILVFGLYRRGKINQRRTVTTSLKRFFSQKDKSLKNLQFHQYQIHGSPPSARGEVHKAPQAIHENQWVEVEGRAERATERFQSGVTFGMSHMNRYRDVKELALTNCSPPPKKI